MLVTCGPAAAADVLMSAMSVPATSIVRSQTSMATSGSVAVMSSSASGEIVEPQGTRAVRHEAEHKGVRHELHTTRCCPLVHGLAVTHQDRHGGGVQGHVADPARGYDTSVVTRRVHRDLAVGPP